MEPNLGEVSGRCLEKIPRDFLWGGLGDEFKYHLVNWRRICTPIQHGGLGVQQLAFFNQALLGGSLLAGLVVWGGHFEGRGVGDQLRWTCTKSGLFEVKSYKTLWYDGDTVFPWKSIWRVKVPLKVALFAWTAALGKILTIDNLCRRMVVGALVFGIQSFWGKLGHPSYSFRAAGLLVEESFRSFPQCYLECYSVVFNVVTWRERNCRAFEDLERHSVELKMLLLQTLFNWMAALCEMLPMSSSLNGTSSPCTSKLEGKVTGSRRTRGLKNILRLHVKKINCAEWEQIPVPSRPWSWSYAPYKVRGSTPLDGIQSFGAIGLEEFNCPFNYLSVRAIVALNLHSYGSGRNPWGNLKPDYLEKRGFVAAHADDGLLEIFGLKQGWHASFVMVELISAKHIAQAAAIRLEIRGGEWKDAYMQMDGEPWKQPLNKGLFDVCGN
uniref:Diacylglycerol kinase accessory domain-containing protein n=1 Tax=Fagus sylvatica TaxID=28930 RepID=A0A2N9HBW9_FAGSY